MNTTRLKSACKSGMGAGQEGIIVDSCTFGSNRANDRHFHAKFKTQPDDEWLHHNGYVCNNPARWEEDIVNGQIEHCKRCAPNSYNVCFAKGCRCHVQGGQFKGGRLEKGKSKKEDGSIHDSFWEELEIELDKAFPKGKCDERGAGLVLFAYAILLHKKYSK